MFNNHLKIALRSFLRNRLYTLINFTGLSVGLATSVLIMLWVQNEKNFDSYHRNSDHIYRVTNTLTSQNPQWIWSSSPYVLGQTALQQVPGIEAASSLSSSSASSVFHVGNNLFQEKKVAQIDSSWFEMFDYDFISGNKALALRNPNSLVITASKSKAWFGSRNAIGQIVKVDTTDFVVQAVVKDNPANSSFQYDILLPIASTLPDENARRENLRWEMFNYQLFFKIKPGAKTKLIEKQLTDLYKANKKDSNMVASLIPLKEIHFNTTFQSDQLPKGNGKTVATIGIIGLLILAIASINYVNLTTALASKRAKEVGLKKLIGASRFRLFRQFLEESLLLILSAVAGALLLISLALPFFNDFTEKKFALDFGNQMLWLILGGTTLVTVLLAGIYPSALLSSLKPVKVLKGENVLGSKNAYFRKGLVVLQFSISILLIIGTLVIDRQLRYIRTQDPGYNREHVFTFGIASGNNAKSNENNSRFIRESIASLTSVKGVATVNQSVVNLRSTHSGSLKWEGKPDDFVPAISMLSAGPELPAVLNLKLVEGRWFRKDFKLDSANVILNEKAIKDFNIKAPVLGQWFEFQGRRGQIIAVAKDFHFRSFHEKIEPMILFDDPSWQKQVLVRTTAANAPKALAGAKKIWDNRFPDRPFSYQFLDEQYNALYKDEQRAGQLFNFFAAIAIMISCLGLFGLATFTAETRIKEIGIRKVLGSSVAGIVGLLSLDFIKLVFLAILIASPFAYYLAEKWLMGFAYQVGIQWWVFLIAGLLGIGIALLTVSFQSIKAAMMSPVDSLRKN